MRRLEARQRASWVLRNTRLRSHSANAHTVRRTQAWMMRLRLMRACRSISKDNGGTELSFWDIGSSYVAAHAECAGTIVGRWLRLLDGGSHHCGSCERRDVRPEAHLQRLWRFPGNFL